MFENISWNNKTLPKSGPQRPGGRKCGWRGILSDTWKKKKIENQRAKKWNILGKHSTKNSKEELTSGKELEEIPHAEESDKEIANVTEESCAGGEISKRNFTVGKLKGKSGISHYMAEVVNDFYGYEYEIRY